MSLTNKRDGAPKICACIMMNHPYPANLPLLRRVYAARFSEVLFLIPFAQLDDPDVVTVYRGSYSHAAYVTDALPRLEQVDCDFFLFVHDDVLLNPKLDEASFADRFPIGLNDSFIPWAHPTPKRLGEWVWYYSLLPKLLHPKSLLFGSGIEPANLVRYLPDADAIRSGFDRSGTPFTEEVAIETVAVEDGGPGMHLATGSPSVVMLDGLAARLDHDDPVQQTIDAETLAALEALTRAFAGAARRDGRTSGSTTIPLPIPLTASAYFTDCYVLPRTRLSTFAHYMGVAGAAGLFVEIIVPVILHAISDRVWKASDLGLDFQGFDRPRKLDEFVDPAVMAIHPFKFSMFKGVAQQDAFVAIVDALRAGRRLEPAMALAADLDPSHTDPMRHDGWHGIEHWGRWASDTRARLHIGDTPSDRVRLHLYAPVTPEDPVFEGAVVVPGLPDRHFEIRHPHGLAEVEVAVHGLPRNGARVIEIISNRLINPRDRDPASPDVRTLGVGLRAIELL